MNRYEIALIDNVNVFLGDAVNKRLDDAIRSSIAVAFVKLSGLQAIEKSLVMLLDRGGTAEIIFGLDFWLTEAPAVREVLRLAESYPRFHPFAFSDPYIDRQPTFHPKLYLFQTTDDRCTFVVGSSNLTRGGLFKNVEINLLIGAPLEDKIVSEVLKIYSRLRNKETLFVPDEEYLSIYRKIQGTVRREGPQIVKREEVREAVKRLRQREEVLPGTVPTQKELVIEAIKALRRDPSDWVHWHGIYQWLEKKAWQLGIEYKWDTLHNSVRGRLNEHTVGKGGEDLFRRKGGVKGRYGMYQLSELGEEHKPRRTIRSSIGTEL